jgi:myo-inositol 2-dehydrogenase/D-chiro-inositol 1-dehydrogenase
MIGAGEIATVHLQCLANRPESVRIVSIADLNPAAASVAHKYGAKFVTDYRTILQEADAVFVCVPTHLHAPIVIDALRAGLHVFCEKPLARTLEQADGILNAAAASAKTLQVGFVRRFDPEWLAFRDVICSGKIGRPIVWHDVASWSGPSSEWYYADELGGGPFLDGAIHNFDFALHMFGPARWVFSHLRSLRGDANAFDTGTTTIRFQSGDELMLAWSWGIPADCKAHKLFEFLGPRGTITWPEDSADLNPNIQFTVSHNSGAFATDSVFFPKDSLADAFAKQTDEFIAAAQGICRPRAGGAEGRESLRVALATLESGRSGQPVNL